ncbi:translocation and assembly module lipoprotein TamL [Sunxiuqinia sp. A32]|uniref:translocation and assembly module lipoprotein TamL n=1 Tax=Sunxiuqinia sp. A32 TaxID=3461496 RepID=UPI004045C82C
MTIGKTKTYLSEALVVLIFLLLLASCSSSRFVPEGQYLLNDTDIEIDNRSINREDLKTHIRQKENLKILGFIKFHLALYNLSSKKSSKGWLKRIGEPPVVYEDYLTLRTKDQLQSYLSNKGYYNAAIKDSLVKNERKQKVNVKYIIEAGIPYRIRNYSYKILDPQLRPLLMADTVNQIIGKGDIFDVDVLNAERERLTSYFKDHGYYNFTTDHIQYVADSTLRNHQVDLELEILDNDLENEFDSIVSHKKYQFRNYLVNPDFVPPQLSNRRQLKNDTLAVDNYRFFFHDELRYKPIVFKNLNRMPDSTYYSLRNVEKTYRALTQLRQFKVVNINFTELDSMVDENTGLLDANFQLSALPRQGFSVDLEGTNSSGNLGVAGNLNYQHRNLYKGAEIFNLNLKGAVERQQAFINENNLDFNTRELGIEGSLNIPKFLSPLKSKRFFNFQIPQTSVSLGYNFQQRPDYTRTVTNLKFGYNWKTSIYRSHYLNLVDFNYVNLYEFNEDFINSIKDLYIKSSFTDHLVFALNYTLIDNTQNLSRRSNYRYFKWSVESAGNLLSAYTKLINKDEVSERDSVTNQLISYQEVLGTRFAQYLKTDFEYRYGYMIDKYNSLVGRAFLGIGLPYGNFDVLPFEKKYFSGGANGIRAWQVRSLGPGTYKAPAGAYPNQSSDIKLEANLEYRYRFVGPVEGALFLDAGNIWAINEKDNRPGAQFRFDQFYKQIAVGTGMGFRFDFTYFIFRLDLGMKLIDPALEEGKRFIIGNYPIKGEHFNLAFAIGYPF